MTPARGSERKRRVGVSIPCFWASGHSPGAPAPVSDHGKLDVRPTTGSPEQSRAPLSLPTLRRVPKALCVALRTCQDALGLRGRKLLLSRRV